MVPQVLLEVNGAADVAAARRAVTQLVPEEDWDLVDRVRLTVSEALTNAIVHGDPPVELLARVDRRVLRVEVADGSPRRGSPQQASATASSGRGLAIVDSLAHRWGIEARGTGKALWLEFHLAAPTVEVSDVRLLSVPVDTYLRAQEHLEGTLHELQLLAASDHEAYGALETAMVTPLRRAMETFGTSRRRGRAEAEAAASARMPRVDFTWELGPDAADAAAAWASGVAALEQLARDGVLLTPPPDPEISALRQWLSEEIIAQLTTGRDPRPFTHSG